MFHTNTLFNNGDGPGNSSKPLAWDISSNTGMIAMFNKASSFNQDISSWNTANVTSMAHTFREANNFNQNIGSWNTSKVINMESMFQSAIAFNQEIKNWDTSKVTNMSSMFDGASNFNQDIKTKNILDDNGNYLYTAWDVSSVTNMSWMFKDTVFNGNISNWDVSAVTLMETMFGGNTAFNQDIGEWDVYSVTNMIYMFADATAFNQDISGWNVFKVTDMNNMFKNANLFDKDIRKWIVSDSTDLTDIFKDASAFQDKWFGESGYSTDENTPNYKFFFKNSPFMITGDISGFYRSNKLKVTGKLIVASEYDFTNENRFSIHAVNGAHQYITLNYTSGNSEQPPADNSTLGEPIIYTTSIDEDSTSFANNNLTNYFRIRWETYIKIPESGTYYFKTTSDDGQILTVKENDIILITGSLYLAGEVLNLN